MLYPTSGKGTVRKANQVEYEAIWKQGPSVPMVLVPMSEMFKGKIPTFFSNAFIIKLTVCQE